MKKSDLLQFLQQKKTSVNLIEVELEGFGTVYIKPMTVAEIENSVSNPLEGVSSLARNIATVICDKEGNRLLDPNDKTDVELIASQNWADLKPVRDAMEKINAPKA